MIELKDVTKRFGEMTAVDSVSFAAYPGEIFGLIGPNGAGKSTTIRMIMNILLPDSGTILFSGGPLSESDKKRIGYLPEERGLYRKEILNDVLLYFASLKGAGRKTAQENIDLWLERFGLIEWKNRKIQELSKGMTQKAQFIAAVAHDPDLMFFDEPFSGLDPVSVDVLRDAILDLSRRNKTILFSTHVMEQAEKLCTRIFLINKGKKIISGRTDDVKDTYGERSVIIEFSGNGDFIDSLPMVESVNRYPRWVEVALKTGASADALLEELVGKVSIRKFEIQSPSLHRIFVSAVNAAEASVKGGPAR